MGMIKEMLNDKEHMTEIIEEMDRELRLRLTPECVDDIEQTVMQKIKERER